MKRVAPAFKQEGDQQFKSQVKRSHSWQYDSSELERSPSDDRMSLDELEKSVEDIRGGRRRASRSIDLLRQSEQPSKTASGEEREGGQKRGGGRRRIYTARPKLTLSDGRGRK